MSLKHTFAGLLGAAMIAGSVPAGAAMPPVSRHLRYGTTVQAFIDPGPTFIHAASSEVRR